MHTTVDIMERLRTDAGRCTIGELIREREAAAQEIRRLRAEIERLKAMRDARPPAADTAGAGESSKQFRPGTLIRINDVCELIGVSRGTVYRWVADGAFPGPVRISEQAVRWRVEDINAWRDALPPAG